MMTGKKAPAPPGFTHPYRTSNPAGAKAEGCMIDRRSARSRSRSGRPPKQDAEEPAMRIIETATRLFASRGFAGTSVEQVAAACGAGKDTIYRRFPSKVALFEGVVEHARSRAVERLQDLVQTDGDALARLRSLLRSFLTINLEPDLVALKRITFSEAVVFEKKGPIPSQPDPLMARLVEAVEAAQAERLLRPGDASSMAAHLIHSVVAIPTTHAMLGGADYEGKEAQDAHFEQVWNWLMTGVAAPADPRTAATRGIDVD